MPRLPLNYLRRDAGTQCRAQTCNLTVADYKLRLVDDASFDFPPVVAFYDGREYWLADGHHRHAAYQLAARKDIPAEIRDGGRRDALLYAAGANAHHGLNRTPADKRRAALTLLQDSGWAAWSDRQIATACNVSHTFISQLRREIATPLLDDVPPTIPDAQFDDDPFAEPEPTGNVARQNEQPDPFEDAPAESVLQKAQSDTAPLRKLQAEMRSIHDRLRAFCSSEGGAYLSSMEVDTACSQIVGMIGNALPAHVCPYCKGEAKGCKACKGRGWVNSLTYRMAPEDLKQA